MPDEYTIGYVLGKQYAEEMYNHRGLAPVMRDILELPDNLDPMKIIESLHESIEDDISALLDDDSITDDDKTSKIHDLFRNRISGSNAEQDDKNEIYVPDDVIIMRNGTVDDDNLFCLPDKLCHNHCPSNISEHYYHHDDNGWFRLGGFLCRVVIW